METALGTVGRLDTGNWHQETFRLKDSLNSPNAPITVTQAQRSNIRKYKQTNMVTTEY